MTVMNKYAVSRSHVYTIYNMTAAEMQLVWLITNYVASIVMIGINDWLVGWLAGFITKIVSDRALGGLRLENTANPGRSEKSIMSGKV